MSGDQRGAGMRTASDLVERAIVEWVEDNRAAGVGLLRDLIRIPSYSGQEGVAADPSSVAGMVFGAAGEHGTRVESQVITSDSENVIELIEGAGKRTLVLEAHTDTVPEGDPTLWHDGRPFSGAEGFVEYLGNRRVAVEVGAARYLAGIRDRMARVWELRSERRLPIVYGRGSFDNKGPVVSTMMAMGALAAALSKTGARLGGTVVGAYTADEETHTTGIRRFACGPDSWLHEHGYLDGPIGEDGFLTDVSGIAMDGSYGWIPIVGHRGSAQFEVRTHGRSAHAATPQLGVNAIEAMSLLLLHLRQSEERMRDRLLGSLEASLLGPPTFAIATTVVGGGVRSVAMTDEGPRVERTGVNSVPNWCQATIDVRFPPSYELTLSQTVELIRRTLDETLNELRLPDDSSYELKVLDHDPPVALARTFEEASQLAMVRLARARAAPFIGFEPHMETAPGGTDATFMIHQAKIPTLVEFGPAGALSHDVHEYVETDSVIAGAKILALMALDILGITE